jgi:glucose-1-phosphate cytidylyltransferase
VKVVILAGGLGTRMREETEFKPKPMVEVGERPILWHIMKNFAHFGLKDFVVATGYRHEVIQDYFLNYKTRNNDFTIALDSSAPPVIHGENEVLGWRVTVANTGAKTMTGGRVSKLREHLGNEPFIVTYGDSLANVDIAALLESHRRSGALATVTMVRPVSRFGILEVDEETGRVNKFREKPMIEGWVNIGFFVMQPEVLTYLDDDSVLEEGPLAALAAAGQLSSFKHEGFWQPMDTYREYKIMNDLWEKGNPPWQNS